MGCASDDADQRESPDAHRTQGASVLGGGNGKISVWQWLGKTEGLRAQVEKISASQLAAKRLPPHIASLLICPQKSEALSSARGVRDVESTVLNSREAGFRPYPLLIVRRRFRR
jgi:hypothetical protein